MSSPVLLEALAAHIQELVAQELAPIKREMEIIRQLVPEWVNQTRAMQITGKSSSALKTESRRKGTKVVVKYEGEKQKAPKYLLAGLLAYNDAKIIRTITGRNLNP